MYDQQREEPLQVGAALLQRRFESLLGGPEPAALDVGTGLEELRRPRVNSNPSGTRAKAASAASPRPALASQIPNK